MPSKVDESHVFHAKFTFVDDIDEVLLNDLKSNDLGT